MGQVTSLNVPLAHKCKFHKRLIVDVGSMFYVGDSVVRIEMDRIHEGRYSPHLYLNFRNSVEADCNIPMRQAFNVWPYADVKLFICAVEYSSTGRAARLVIEFSSEKREGLKLIRQ